MNAENVASFPVSPLGAVRCAANGVAQSMLSNAAFVLKELPGCGLGAERLDAIRSMCEGLVGTKHDVVHELSELDDQRVADDSETAVRYVDRICGWIAEEVPKVDTLVRALQAAAERKEPGCELAAVLVAESAANVFWKMKTLWEAEERYRAWIAERGAARPTDAAARPDEDRAAEASIAPVLEDSPELALAAPARGDGPLSGCVFVTPERMRAGLAPDQLACELPSWGGRAPMRDALSAGDGAVPAEWLAGRYWWTRRDLRMKFPSATNGSYDGTQTTEEIFATVRDGYWVRVMDGPFDTEDDAGYALDVAWESPE